MDELTQALAKVREAEAHLTSMADYAVAESMLEAPDLARRLGQMHRMLAEAVGTLAKISQLHNDAAALIIQHLESLD